jgi:hypothetical protein
MPQELVEQETGNQEYWLEIWDRNGIILHDETRKTPIPRYEVGTELEVPGAIPRYYVVRDNYVGTEDVGAKYARRQTLIVERIDHLSQGIVMD